MKKIFNVFFMMLALVLFSVNSYAEVGAVVKGILGGKSIEDAFDSIDREPLKGISDVYLVIERLDPVANKLGITEDQIQTDVEIRLRKAGIKVKKRDTLVMFYVNVGITNGINGLYGVSETVEVKDMVSLVREPKIKFQTQIWDKHMFGIVGELRVSDAIRKGVGDLTDEFILEYLRAKQD